MQSPIDPSILQRIQDWLDGPYDSETKKEIKTLLKTNPQALADAFFKDISFGTGGLRGIMGVGTNRLNIYTIRNATQGLAQYIKKTTQGPWSIFIGYDVRNNSLLFAKEAARVCAGNGIRVFLTEKICPTPLVSFGCRHFRCHAAIMITASHNPPEYNGYKVYWNDGGQIVPPHDAGIMQEVKDLHKKIQLTAFPNALIEMVGNAFEKTYIQAIRHLELYPKVAKKNLKILYSPLHGTGLSLVPEALHSWGFDNIQLIEKQSSPDGNFPHAPQPNPEEKTSLSLGTEKLQKEQADLFLATDPDADRIGVVEKGPHFFSGNQVACLLVDHICKGVQKNGMPPFATCIKSIVTTELFKAICDSYDVQCIDVLTGFKYIGEKITLWEKSPKKQHFLFGAEESCGYLFGKETRDKDAISTACVIAEMTALAKEENTTLQGRLLSLYKKHGVYREKLLSFSFTDTAAGMLQMQEALRSLRTNPPIEIGGTAVQKMEDFLPGSKDFPSSDVLRFWLEDQSKIVIRPSGTEPKLKIYLEVTQRTQEALDAQIGVCEKKLEVLTQYFKTLFSAFGIPL